MAPKEMTPVRILKPRLFAALEGRTATFRERRSQAGGGWIDTLYLDEPYVIPTKPGAKLPKGSQREIRLVYVAPEDYEVLGEG